MARPVVLLPQPLSPTRPSVSPRRISRSMPSTAYTAPTLCRKTMPLVMGKWTLRSSTVTRVSSSAPAAGAALTGQHSCRHLRAGDQLVARGSRPRAGRRRWARARGTACQHSSLASQQRGAKLQPGGRWARSGGRPGDRLQALACAARRGAARCAAGRRCRGGAGGRRGPWPGRSRRCAPRTSRGCARTCRRPRRGRG